MNKILLCVLFLIPSLSFSQEKVISQKEIITNQYKGKDSLHILLVYKERIGCIESDYGKISIKKKSDSIYYSHISSKYETAYFKAKDKGIIDIINDFETIAKTNNILCSGILGHSGASIELTINATKSNFFYCREDLQGIRLFISQLEALQD